MNNHKSYNEIESGVTYRVLEYTNDDYEDHKFINKFIKKHKFCKLILRNFRSYIQEGYPYHEYYFPGFDLSKTTYYENGNIILEIEEQPDPKKYNYDVSNKFYSLVIKD